MRAAVVRNPLSHANKRSRRPAPADTPVVEPTSPKALADDLARLAADGVELLVIDGGDGTVREVVSALPAAFGTRTPLLAIVPSGKTNILAFDLGIPEAWSPSDAVGAARRAQPTFNERAQLQLQREGSDDAPIRGFVFGAAGYVRGTAMAMGVHKAHVFHNASVAVTIGGAMAETLGGGGPLRRGEPMTLSVDGGEPRAGARLVMMATTLQRLPYGMRPFGPVRPGLKFLDVDAPPRLLALALPLMLWSRRDRWLERRGYRRGLARVLRLSLGGSIIVDGEVYPGGDITLSEGPALRFVTP